VTGSVSTALLDGKRALITGGSRGLGRAICCAFAKQGARVAFSYNKNEKAAAETCEAVEALGGQALPYQVSVTDLPATETMVRDLCGRWDGIDVLVNNAAITQNLPLALLEEQDFDRVMGINVKGTFLTSKAVMRTMIRQKSGVVLNIGSLAGTRMIDAPIHYCASKAAIVGLTESMAKEVARHGIRVLCLAPGLLEGGVGRNLPEHRLADYLKHCALGRVGTFAEVAKLAAFMVSDHSSYMNGATVVMDGGL